MPRMYITLISSEESEEDEESELESDMLFDVERDIAEREEKHFHLQKKILYYIHQQTPRLLCKRPRNKKLKALVLCRPRQSGKIRIPQGHLH